MRPIVRPRRLKILLVVVLLASGTACGSEAARSPEGVAGEAEPPQAAVSTATVPGDTAAAVSEVARPVATALVQTLGGTLRTQMQERGPVGAMEFCNVQALPLTQQVAAEHGMQVKRTSWRLRNPSNAPDELEVAALRHFEPVRGPGSEAEPWVQRDPDGGWRYYQPLPTADACLNCHGSAEELAPGVADALARLYPEDEATGFEEGSLRGLLRVTVPAEALEDDAN